MIRHNALRRSSFVQLFNFTVQGTIPLFPERLSCHPSAFHLFPSAAIFLSHMRRLQTLVFRLTCSHSPATGSGASSRVPLPFG